MKLGHFKQMPTDNKSSRVGIVKQLKTFSIIASSPSPDWSIIVNNLFTTPSKGIIVKTTKLPSKNSELKVINASKC